MFISKCKQGGEWEDGIMQDYQDLRISPAAGVINYGQGLFEGMKARRSADGCRRLGMPPVSEKMFLDAVRKVVEENIRWLPPTGKGELYIRPLIFGS